MEEEEAEEGEKSEYFYRLIHLVYDLGAEVLLKLFKKDIPQGLTVEDFINSKANVLQELKGQKKTKVFNKHTKKTNLIFKRVFNKHQIEILDEIPPDVSGFDISLLCILIINLTNIHPPNADWDIASLSPSDRSAGAQLLRFREIRNETIAHRSKTTMKKSDFEMFWNSTDNILVHLAGEVSQTEKDHVKEKIEEFKTEQLVENQRCKLKAKIMQEDIALLMQRDDEYNSRLHALEDQSNRQKVQVTFPAVEKENDQMKHNLQRELVDHYLQNSYCKTTIAILIDDEEIDIKHIFVEPTMERVNHDSLSKASCDKNEEKDSKGTKSLEDIFKEDGKTIRKVCVSGNAGQGKTTLCQMIVSSWCKVHDNNELEPATYEQLLKPFDYLFYIPLRNHSISDVVEMIKTDIVKESSHGVLKEVLKNESEKCLIILDGLDEWQPSEDCKHKVPYIDPREKFTVLITSRPWKLEKLRPKMSEIGQELTLCGINQNSIGQGMVELLNKKYGKDKNYEGFMWNLDNEIKSCFGLNERYEKVKHLAEIPIILTQMVCMWYDDEEFGNTHVEIYSKMLDYLFCVAFKRGKHTCTTLVKPQKSPNTKLVNVFKGCSRCEEYSELLSKLSVLAFHTLFNEKNENSLVFLHSVTEFYQLTENDVKFCLSVGILSQSKFSGKANSQLKKLSFLHKTVQEFLAAIFIACGGENTFFHSMLKTLNNLDDVLEMSQVLIFLSGLKPDLLEDMSRHVAMLTDKDESVLQARRSLWKEKFVTTRVHDIIKACIDEVPKDKKLDSKVVLKDYFKIKLLFREENMSENKMISYLDLEHVKSFQQSGFKMALERFVWTELSGHDIVKLCVDINSPEHVCHLTSIVERCVLSLKCLSVKGTISMDLVSLNDLLVALNKVCHLTCFNLSYVKLTHSDIENLGRLLSHKTDLREITLASIQCATCERERCNFRIDLSHHKQLQYLKITVLKVDIVSSDEFPLEYCEINVVECDVSIINKLKLSASLQELIIWGGTSLYCERDNISTTVHSVEEDNPSQLCLYKVLNDVIPTLKNLRELQLFRIDFKQDILKFSPDMTSLVSMSLGLCTMTLQCLQDFIDSLPQTLLKVWMFKVSICPKDDLSTAVKYITDRCLVDESIVKSMKPIKGDGDHTENDEDDSITLSFRPHH